MPLLAALDHVSMMRRSATYCMDLPLKLYPPPRSATYTKQQLPIAGRNWIRIPGKRDQRTQDAVTTFIRSGHSHLQLTHGNPAPEQVLLTVELTRDLSGEAYRLVCTPSGIVLAAANARGVWNGLMTTSQILAQTRGFVPCFTIKDSPDFHNRGVMLDISRCKVPTMATLFEMIDAFARLKYNQVQLYTEHTFAFAGHPVVSANSSPLNAEETLALQAWCRDRFIELVPNFNSFGHFERWLRHPQYKKYAECPDGFIHPFSNQKIEFGSTLKPNRQSLQLLRGLYDEYLPLFESDQFNVGGDEPWELGQGYSKSRCEKVGTTRVYVDFLAQIQKAVQARGRRMMFWSDIVLREPDSLKGLSRDLIALNWGYEGNHPFTRECRLVAAAGLPFYVCPGTSSWNSLTGRTRNAQDNLASAAKAGLSNGAIGYLVTDWGDHGHHQYQPISYQGFLLGACHAWHHKASSNIDVGDGINRMLLADPDSAGGEMLVQLGEVLELAPSPQRNATIFNRLLFWQLEHEPGAVTRIGSDALRQCVSAFNELESRLGALSRDDLLRREIANAIRLARHGVNRLQLFRGEGCDVHMLRQELEIAIGEHQALWLARNRPGGLQESTGYLLRSLGAL